MPTFRALITTLLLAASAVAQEHVTFPTEDGGLIHADLYGKGERTVLLAHGGRFNKESWKKQAETLEKAGFRVLALDFRGYGKSQGPGQAEPLSAPLYLDVLGGVRYLRKTGAKTVAVVGGSMGGGAAGNAAVKAKPDEIDRLVFLGSGGSDDEPEKMQGRKLVIATRDDLGPGDVPRLPKIRELYAKTTGTKKLIVLEGSAHAQFMFDTDQGERVMQEIVSFLSEGAGHGQTVAATAATPRFLAEWGEQGSEPGEFHFPIGIAINAADEIFVTDFYNDRVQKFSVDGTLMAVIAVLPNPGGITISRSGDLYLAHFAEKKREQRTTDRISVYDSAGKLLRQWGRTGDGDGEFDCPGGLAHRDGRVYVADQTNRRVQVFDDKGKFLFKWGEHGTKPGQFGGNVSIRSRVGGPQFLTFDSKGNLYTTEGSVGRIQKFTPEGKFLLAWGDNEVKPGSFGGAFSGFKDRKATLQGPVAICIDRHDRVWVSAVGGRIQQFTGEGDYLGGFGAAGTEPGAFYAPHGLAFDSRGHLYVVDAFNHRVQKFAVE